MKFSGNFIELFNEVLLYIISTVYSLCETNTPPHKDYTHYNKVVYLIPKGRHYCFLSCYSFSNAKKEHDFMHILVKPLSLN